MEIFYEDIFTFLFIVALANSILETLFIIFWNKTYFPLGIPLLKYSSKYNSISNTINLKRLNMIDDDKALAKIIFKEHSSNTFMFRESFSFKDNELRGGYSLLIRGMLYIDVEDSQITIYGILNTFPIVFILTFAIIGLFSSALGFIIFLILLIFETSIYFTQTKRYKSIARRVASIIDLAES